MDKTFVKELYYGRISPWEGKKRSCGEQEELNSRIREHKALILQGMPEENSVYIEELEALYSKEAEAQRIEGFEEGLRLGALFMISVLQGE